SMTDNIEQSLAQLQTEEFGISRLLKCLALARDHINNLESNQAKLNSIIADDKEKIKVLEGKTCDLAKQLREEKSLSAQTKDALEQEITSLKKQITELNNNKAQMELTITTQAKRIQELENLTSSPT